MEACVIKEKESRHYINPPRETKGWVSYCCFILLEDHKLLLAKRTSTFYCSYVYSCLTKQKTEDVKLIEVIRNFNLYELVDLILCLEEQGMLHEPFTRKEITHLKNFFKKKIFRNIDLTFLSNDFINEMNNVVNDFYDIFFLKNPNDNLYLENTSTVVLPGGKMEPGDKNIKQTIIREVQEEINLDISNALYLNDKFEFVSFSGKDNCYPILECTTEDRVLNRKYIDKIFVLKIDKRFDEIDFKPNKEICSIFTLPVNNKVYGTKLLEHLIQLKN